MHDNQALQMMGRCREEIKTLRAQLAAVQPKADAYDRLAQVLDMMPRRPQGMSEDLVWLLDQEMEKLRAKQRSEETSTAAAMARGEID